MRKPVGVVAVIVPWNLPLLLLTWKVAPGAGLRQRGGRQAQSEETPSSATLLAEVMAAAGVPDGVFNLVHGFGPDSAGRVPHHATPASTRSPSPASRRTGSAIMRAAAPTA